MEETGYVLFWGNTRKVALFFHFLLVQQITITSLIAPYLPLTFLHIDSSFLFLSFPFTTLSCSSLVPALTQASFLLSSPLPTHLFRLPYLSWSLLHCFIFLSALTFLTYNFSPFSIIPTIHSSLPLFATPISSSIPLRLPLQYLPSCPSISFLLLPTVPPFPTFFTTCV